MHEYGNATICINIRKPCHLSFVLILLFQKTFNSHEKKAQKVPKKELEFSSDGFQLLKASHGSEDWMFGLYRFFLKFVRRYDIIGQVIVTL
jgi:hypothetical protein